MAHEIRYRLQRAPIVLAGLLLWATLAASGYAQTVSYDYDQLDRVNRAEYLDGTVVDYAYDGAGNRTLILHSLDTTAPTATVEANSGAPATNNSSVTLTLTCPDSTGCLQMQFSNDGIVYSTPELYAGTKTWALSSGSGAKTVYVKVRDKAGNWSSSQTTTITVDTVPPTTTSSLAGGTYTTPQLVALTCSDGAGSGCTAIYYTTDGSTPNSASSIYSGPIAISSYVTLRFFSRDLAGNNESPQSVTYIVDTQAPYTSASPAGCTFYSWQSVALSCSDGIGSSGCDKIYYTTDGSTPTTSSSVYSGPITIATNTTVRFFSVDVAGNSESPKTESYTIAYEMGIDSHTKLILHMDGTDGSTTFTDFSLSPKTITTYGNAQIDTAQSKFGGASGLFDGNGDYLTVADSDDWYFGTGNFTIDGWLKLETSPNSFQVIASQWTDLNNRWFFYTRNGTLAFYAASGGIVSGFIYGEGGTPLYDNNWHHVAVVRSGIGTGCVKLYIDGTAIPLTVNTDFSSNSIPNIASPLKIGMLDAGGYEYYLKGWIDELRISKGIARWTSNFTPPAGPYASFPVSTAFPAGSVYSSPQTVTLTCNNNGSPCNHIYYTIDGSSPTTSSSVYSSPITISENTTLKFFGQDLAGNNETSKTETYTINPGEPGVDVYTKLMLHMDGTDGGTTFVDSSQSAKTISAYGNVQNDTAQSKFGGASGLFDGIGDYLTVPDSDDWHFGTGNFTIDAWIRRADTATYGEIVAQVADDSHKWIFYVRNGTLAFVGYTGSGTNVSFVYGASGTYLNDGAWHHVAVVRNGASAGCVKLYIDGNAIGLTTQVDLGGNSLGNFEVPLEIGRQNIAGSNNYFNGWIDELRISKGVARWTSNFTPPSGPYIAY